MKKRAKEPLMSPRSAFMAYAYVADKYRFAAARGFDGDNYGPFSSLTKKLDPAELSTVTIGCPAL